MMTTPHFKAKAKKLALSATLAIGLMSVQVQQAAAVPTIDAPSTAGNIAQRIHEFMEKYEWVSQNVQRVSEMAHWATQVEAMKSGDMSVITSVVGSFALSELQNSPAFAKLLTTLKGKNEDAGCMKSKGSQDSYEACIAQRKALKEQEASLETLQKQVQTRTGDLKKLVAEIKSVTSQSMSENQGKLQRLQLELQALQAQQEADATAIQLITHLQQVKAERFKLEQRDAAMKDLNGSGTGSFAAVPMAGAF